MASVKRLSLIRKYRESDAWLWTEVFAVVIGLTFFIPTSIALWVDLQDRKAQRVSQAWELVTRHAPGNSGKTPALEFLNSQGIPLVGLDLSQEEYSFGTYLENVNLSGADLSNSNLSGVIFCNADLTNVDFSNALLADANLSGSDLSGASFSGAFLEGAILIGANFSDADLFGADMDRTILSGADLRSVKNLSQAWLDDGSCGSAETKLPAGFTIEICPAHKSASRLSCGKENLDWRIGRG